MGLVGWLDRQFRRLSCWLIGHDWRVLRDAGCHSHLMHLNSFIACDADCRWCGEQWRDYQAHIGHGVI